MTSSDKASLFRSLHAGPGPLRLVNAWDPLSARVFALAGAPAVGTSSFAVAFARGHVDGQHIPTDDVVDVAAAIVAAVDVPVTVDIEAGYGTDPADVDRMVARIVATGAVGINIEDGRPDAPGELYSTQEQCRRIEAARQSAAREGVDLFINARCDVYFGAKLAAEDRTDTAKRRLTNYVDAGASGVFLPGLTDLAVIAEITDAVSAPLNVMVSPGLPAAEDLTAAGVRRISQGGASFLHALGYLERMTTAYLQSDDLAGFGGDVPPALQLLPGLVRR